MRAIITVTEMPTMPGRYTVRSSESPRARDVNNPAAAAAAAMEFALRAPAGYQVFAPEDVLRHIPQDMRGRN